MLASNYNKNIEDLFLKHTIKKKAELDKLLLIGKWFKKR
jgi:hypothetical protein